MEKVNLELKKGLEILVSGEKYEDPTNSYFEIRKIELIQGDLVDLINYSFKRDLMQEIETRVLESLNNK